MLFTRYTSTGLMLQTSKRGNALSFEEGFYHTRKVKSQYIGVSMQQSTLLPPPPQPSSSCNVFGSERGAECVLSMD